MLVVGARHGDDDVRTTENRDAVCAAVENLLLAATAAGLGSYWSSCPAGAERAVAEVAGFTEAVSVIAVVYLAGRYDPAPHPSDPPSTSSTRPDGSDDACRAQPGNGVVGDPELTEHLVGVFAEPGRGAGDREPLAIDDHG